jgi:hypothetical protein
MAAWILHNLAPADRLSWPRPPTRRDRRGANANRRGIATSTFQTWESAVPRTHTPPTKPPPVLLTWLDDDQIEQRIIRAYVHLALDSTERNGSRVVTIARAGVLEARLSEVPAPGKELGLPHFWLEIYSHATRSVIDSRGCSNFDEYELVAAVKMVTNALNRNRMTH